jgi:glycosyltransferase involved in cell wall biosynthesis
VNVGNEWFARNGASSHYIARWLAREHRVGDPPQTLLIDQNCESKVRHDEQSLDILYFGNDWFAENRTSSHHIARRLAREHRVYYIECPGLRAPQSSGRDFKKIGSKVARFARGPQSVGANLKVCTLLQVPLHRFRLVRWLNQAIILATLRWLMWRERIQQPLAWFMIPHLAAVVGRIGERMSVYYCTDDYSAMPGVNERAVRLMDEEATKKSDVVFVASETLLEAKRRLNPNVHVSPHGVDLDHFAQALDHRLEVPAEMSGISHPIVGFFGLIERWIDLDLIRFLAESRPHWSFVMIGRLAAPAEELKRLRNVHFLGKRAYEDLPVYGKQFDVGILPYRLNRQVIHANPLKLREYLAMGKPVVSVSTNEISKYSDVIEIALSHTEFLAKLDAVLSRPSTPDEIQKRLDRVANESWDARVERILKIVRQCRSEADERASPLGGRRLPAGTINRPEVDLEDPRPATDLSAGASAGPGDQSHISANPVRQ